MVDPGIRAKRGQSGESHARAWLEGHGYTCVATNWHCPDGELDLVMRTGNELVFVEVKTRVGDRFGRAADAVSESKRQKILDAAEWFVADHPQYHDMIWRGDIVAVTIHPATGIAQVEHLVNALVES